MADVQLEHGYTRIANEILEALAKIKLTPTAYRLIVVIWRYTYGFNRKSADLSLSFLSAATSCDKRQIQRELKRLEEQHIILQTIVSGVKRTITFNKDFSSWIGEIAIGEIDNGKSGKGAIGENVKGAIGEIDNQERKGKKPLNKSMPEATASDSPTAIELILNDKSSYPISQKRVDEWSALYPAVDTMQELRKMKGWLDVNPAKRKTKRGVLRFVNSWLAREQDRGRQQETKSDSWEGVQSL